MKKNRKNKVTGEMRFLQYTAIIFVSSSVLYFASSLGLKSYNNTVSIQKQSIETQIAAAETQNNSLQVEIRQLASADRVNEVAASSGMSYNQNNISTVTDGN
jgi:cell division protein FtsL